MAGKDMVAQGQERRRQIAAFIQDYQLEHGFSPSMNEIGAAVGINSPNAVRGHLMKMAEEGVISMQPRTARSIRLLKEPEPV